MSNISKLIIFLYGTFLLLIYIFFILIYVYLLNIFNKAISFINFTTGFIELHYNIIDMYNVYREYIFDNQSNILEMYPYEYLIKVESKIYESITSTSQYTHDIINSLNQTNKEADRKSVV